MDHPEHTYLVALQLAQRRKREWESACLRLEEVTASGTFAHRMDATSSERAARSRYIEALDELQDVR